MTADAVTENVYVVEVRWHPCRSDVTVIAGITAGNVTGILSGRCNAVVATNTISNNTEVIENSRKPAC